MKILSRFSSFTLKMINLKKNITLLFFFQANHRTHAYPTKHRVFVSLETAPRVRRRRADENTLRRGGTPKICACESECIYVPKEKPHKYIYLYIIIHC